MALKRGHWLIFILLLNKRSNEQQCWCIRISRKKVIFSTNGGNFLQNVCQLHEERASTKKDITQSAAESRGSQEFGFLIGNFSNSLQTVLNIVHVLKLPQSCIVFTYCRRDHATDATPELRNLQRMTQIRKRELIGIKKECCDSKVQQDKIESRKFMS